MALSRRLLLAAIIVPSALPCRAAPSMARLHPKFRSAIGFSPLPGERVAFHADGIEGAVILPVARAAVRAVFPLADREVVLLSFAADPPTPRGRLDLAAVVGCDRGMLRVLALEVLTWQSEATSHSTADQQAVTGYARLFTRIDATSDHSRLRLRRDAAAPRSPLALRHESWTDLLSWQGGDALTDAPTRPPVIGTWQYRLALDRLRVIARLGRPSTDLTGDLLTLCRPPDLSLP